jgi:hypothetical protein
LAEHLEPEATPDEEAPVRGGHRYLTNRREALDYPRALALGLPIGSGLIESGHRHEFQSRLKMAGTAWLPEHADQIARRRVLRANKQWLSIWNQPHPPLTHPICPCTGVRHCPCSVHSLVVPAR